MTARLADDDRASQALVARHLRGDPEAFAELVSLFSGRVFHLALRFTGDRSEAEDITQESFLRAFRALPRSRTELPFRPWLLRIALNLCRDWARRKRPDPFSDLGDAGDAEADTQLERLADSGPLPAEMAETNAQLADLRQAVQDLPPTFRLILTLRYNEELSYEAIGQLLHIPPATVGTSLLRARRQLRAALERTDEVTDDPTS